MHRARQANWSGEIQLANTAIAGLVSINIVLTPPWTSVRVTNTMSVRDATMRSGAGVRGGE